MTKMRCISLWAPWSILCVIAKKKFETRSWSAGQLGPVLIHSSLKWDRKLLRIASTYPFCEALRAGGYDNPWLLPRGAIIGCCTISELYEIHADCLQSDLDTIPRPTGDELEFGDYAPGRFAWKLVNAFRFEKPIPYAGRQKFFDVPLDLVAEQMRKARAA